MGLKSTDDTHEHADAQLTMLRAFFVANGITTQAQWNAFIDSRTDAQLLNLLRAYFKNITKAFT